MSHSPFPRHIFQIDSTPYPPEGFENLEQAQQWVLEFVQWYNHEHRHSAIRYVTPQQRYEGQNVATLEQRARLYEQAKAPNPERWTRHTRNWEPVGDVWLNPGPVLEAA